MKQNRQATRYRHKRALLRILSSTLHQFQTPAPEITVFAKWTENIVRSLHHQRSQICVTFFADVQLRLALA